MTFAKAIRILDLLDHDKEVAIAIDSKYVEGDYERVAYITKYDEIGDYMKYFTDPQYKYFTQDSDGFLAKEIRDDGLEEV